MAVIGAVAQSNEFVDGLLESDAVTVGQAAYLVLVASDNLGGDADEARAFELLDNFGWAPEGATVDTPILMKDYSFLLMNAFGLKGGFMYGFFPSPRYAYRQLKSSLVIQGRSDPDMTVVGNSAIRMLGRVFDIKGISE
ncbi:MAG: hypothetical protein CVV47_08635 [Spirochaetae bacterium HGW-Spirochaetae-3]|nr:MAG: hypothetical protein CVV47_08635 [Spirochaetae bacterium HGW-Spirochaetae-3]